MSNDSSQGGEANRQGDALHRDIIRSLADHDFIQVSLASTGAAAVAELPRHLAQLLIPSRRVFAEWPVLGEGFFGGACCPNAMAYEVGWSGPLAIAGRHQSSSGSARDKLFRLKDEIIERYCCPAILVLDGPWLAGDRLVMQWAREQVPRSQGRLPQVFQGMHGFRQWLTAGCPFPEPESPKLF